jgi:CRP/FNR family transcriptional regulator
LSVGAYRRLAASCRVRELAKREILFHERGRGEAVYVLTRGAVRLHKTGPGGAETVIRTLRPGETFAEVVLFEEPHYPVTAVALTPATVIAVPRRNLLALLDNRSFRSDFFAMLMRKNRYLTERVRRLMSCSVEERFFLFLREQYGGTTKITPDISKSEMAAAIGATPETFSRMIQKLRTQGLLRWPDRTISLPEGFWSRWTATV